MNKTIFIGNDHAGVELKKLLIASLKNVDIHNCGSDSEVSVDYPDFAKMVVKDVLATPGSIGILICGSGIGMSIAANRYAKIRAALCHNIVFAELARQHNDANILVLGARFVSGHEAIQITNTFLNTEFLRQHHQVRIEKIEAENA